ncbi:nuclease-related domain-containing protein [Bacillus canaveralius]|uniref:nuclease-related domain-containing protein n=1 Tax=Bacillus canaveralius TaxID=1403243 RepID=UPI0015E0F13A|nr:nuclease-related domain-containing protein [Bacillus canaveralius]
MIVKERTVPVKIKLGKALLRRLPKNHPKRATIEQDLAKGQAGYKGEEALDFYLKRLPQKNFYIFQDLRLQHTYSYFQIDTLILSPCFAVILEVKNISGTLYFDPYFQQLIRTMNDKVEGFQDPLTQVRRQSELFKKWITEHNIPDIPIKNFVVISHPSTIITTPPENSQALQTVCHAFQLVSKIEALTNHFIKEKLSEKNLKKLNRLLIKKHNPLQYNIQHYNISQNEILKGVHCPECSFIPMARVQGAWVCANCNTRAKDAHVETIDDYFLLIRPTVTNKQLRQFLQISSPDLCNRILRALNLPCTGKGKGRIYFQSEPLEKN